VGCPDAAVFVRSALRLPPHANAAAAATMARPRITNLKVFTPFHQRRVGGSIRGRRKHMYPRYDARRLHGFTTLRVTAAPQAHPQRTRHRRGIHTARSPCRPRPEADSSAREDPRARTRTLRAPAAVDQQT